MNELELAHVVARIASLVIAAGWVYAVHRWGGRWAGIGGLLLLVVLAWLGATHPAERLYGLQMPGDRIRNLSWCMTVAAGNSPLTTGIVGGVSLEPFWASLVAAVSLFSPDRVLLIYPYLSLAGMVALSLSLYFHFHRPDDLRGVLVALFVVLIATGPLEFIGPYRAFFAKMFLLKPNHTLGLVVIPIVLGSILRTADAGRPLLVVRSGLLLGLLSLVFVVHWAFVCFCLGVYALLRIFLARDGLRSELAKLVAIVAISSAFVAPGVYVLLKYFPAALTLARGTYPELPMMSDWGDIMPPYTSLLLQVTLDQGVLFYLGVVGGAIWLAQKSRHGLMWAAVLVGSYLLWAVNCALYLTARAREADEFYYFVIFALAVAAGNAVFEIARFVARTSGRTLRAAVALAIALSLPLMTPAWWWPTPMDNYFRNSSEPVQARIIELTDWIRAETEGTAVFLVTGDLFQWIPAFSGRRTLFAPDEVLGALQAEASEAVVPDGVDYVVWDLEMMEAVGTNRIVPETWTGWEIRYVDGHLRVYGKSTAS